MTETNGNPNRAGRIYWIGGSKGGVGKSMMTVVTLDYLIDAGEKVLLVECDTSNPDVWKAYSKQLDGELIDLDEADGWIRLVNACDGHRDGVVVVNMEAIIRTRGIAIIPGAPNDAARPPLAAPRCVGILPGEAESRLRGLPRRHDVPAVVRFPQRLLRVENASGPSQEDGRCADRRRDRRCAQAESRHLRQSSRRLGPTRHAT
jgi:hypothetical protein